MGAVRKINLNITDFKQFRQGGYLYVDKTRFIEHFMEKGDNILLFSRPRRMGKSMNLTMLKYFFDLNEHSEEIFKGLYIEKSPVYKERNKHLVIYLNFKEMRADDYVMVFADRIRKELERYLKPAQIAQEVRQAFNPPYPMVKSLLYNACENLYHVYGITPYILIDEYDKLIMDNVHTDEFEKILGFINAVMTSALKDNPFLGRAVIIGVNRISQESMFSDLNNITVCDVFKKSVFDSDFGFSEEEVRGVLEEISGQEKMDSLRIWYNNYRIGDKKVYFSYSVLSALSEGELGNYWGRSGAMDFIRKHLTPKRVEQITDLINGFPNKKLGLYLKDRLSAEDLGTYQKDSAFYSLLVQTGYLTYDPPECQTEFSMAQLWVFLPNNELKYVWQEFIFQNVYEEKPQEFGNIISDIKDLKVLETSLTDALNHKLSYYDFDAREPEKTYHVYVAGMMTALGYKWESNRESGLGRYDLAVELPKSNLIFEFKKAKEAAYMEKSANEAVAQIKEKLYGYGLSSAAPTFLIGVGFYEKLCCVVAQKAFIQ